MGYEVGQEVMYGQESVEALKRSTVVKVGKKITLADGTEWVAINGRQWGRGSETWYLGPYLHEFDAARFHASRKAEVQRRIVRKLERTNWQSMTFDQLKIVDAALNEATKEGEA